MYWQPLSWVLEENVREFALMNPDYELWLWKAVPQDLPARYLSRAMEAPTPRLRADLIRYWTMKEYGGFYVDIDCRPIRPFNDTMRLMPIFMGVFAYYEHFIDICFIGSVPGHELWQIGLDNCYKPEVWRYPENWFGSCNVFGSFPYHPELYVLPPEDMQEFDYENYNEEFIRWPRQGVSQYQGYLKHYRMSFFGDMLYEVADPRPASPMPSNVVIKNG